MSILRYKRSLQTRLGVASKVHFEGFSAFDLLCMIGVATGTMGQKA